MLLKDYAGFSMAHLLWSNLRVRPVRTLLSVLAVALQVFLVLFVVGLTSGVVAEWGRRVEGVGADLLVQPPNSSIFFALSNAVMQEGIGEKIAGLKGVDEAAPVLVVVETRTMDVIYGIDYDRFSALSTGFLYRQGGRFENSDQVVIDDIKAQSKKLKVGDTVTLLGRDFKVSGVVAHGKGARYFIPLRTAQDMIGAEGRVSMFYVRSTGDTELARQQLVRLLPGHRIRSMSEYLTLMNSANLPELQPFIRSMVGVGVIISFLVVLLTMHTAVLERTREIGILKALGASRIDILRLVMGETFLMAVSGIAFGLASTYCVRAIFIRAIPSLTILISADWILRAIVLALAGAAAGALYPAYRATGFDPVDALAYE